MASRIPPEQRSKALQHYYNNLEAKRAINRQRAKEYYYRDKAIKIARNAEYKKNNPEKWKNIKALSNRKYNKRRFFYVRAVNIIGRTQDTINPETLSWTLACLWHKQRGLCAYTGYKLKRDAHVDHKTPICKGGANEPCNLHWVTPAANSCKASMTHDEFMRIATDIVAYIASKTPPCPRSGSLLETPPNAAWRRHPVEKKGQFSADLMDLAKSPKNEA